MMFNYKRTRKPNKNKTNKKAITMQAMSRSGSASGARMSTDHTQQEGVGGTSSFDEADAVTLYPAPSATPGAHNNPWDGGDYFPAFDSSYSQDPSSFQATQVPMNPNPYSINTRQHLPMQTQTSSYEMMQPTQQPEPNNQYPASTSGDNALHLGGHPQYFSQGPPVEFIQYPSSSVQGTSDVSTQYPHTWSNYQQQPEWSMEEDNDDEASALPRESTQNHSRDAQPRRR
ncbi:hypothetical protein BJ165DRAFT_1435965 [Panaeolus papilionaceus]|nr:hypothetical protein BJ165DRAFT_1435965 [Panaeolus papilionaceus]